MKKIIFFILMILSIPVIAHEPDEIGHYGFIRVSQDRLTVDLNLIIGSLLANYDRRMIDQNNDNRLDQQEQSRFLKQSLDEQRVRLILELNGNPLRGELRESQILLADSITGPIEYTLNYVFEYSLPLQSQEQRYQLSFQDSSFMDVMPRSNIHVELDPFWEMDIYLTQERTGGEGLANSHFTNFDTRYFEFQFWEKGLFQPKTVDLRSRRGGPAVLPKSTLESRSTASMVSFMKTDQYSFIFLISAILVALVFGMGHALSPGHGKTVVAAYLVGSQGTLWNAIFLGLVVTFTHSFSVILLGIIFEFSSHFIERGKIQFWLQLFSAFLIVAIGILLFIQRLKQYYAGELNAPANHPHDHVHGQPHAHLADSEHGHSHGIGPHRHSHAHIPHGEVTWWNLLTLGISGGIVPCPTGLVIVAAAFAWNKMGLGLILVLSFSFGIALVLIFIGILFVKAKELLQRFSGGGSAMGKISIGSAVFITLLGTLAILKTLIDHDIILLNL